MLVSVFFVSVFKSSFCCPVLTATFRNRTCSICSAADLRLITGSGTERLVRGVDNMYGKVKKVAEMGNQTGSEGDR
jgi:hypothetical protein